MTKKEKVRRKRRSHWDIVEDLKKQYPFIKDIDYDAGYGFTESGNAWDVMLHDGYCYDQMHWYTEGTLKEMEATLKKVTKCDCRECKEALSKTGEKSS